MEGYEEKYSFVEKYALGFVRTSKKFRYLASNNKIYLMVSYSSAKIFLLGMNFTEKRAGWITKVMENDIEIKAM